MLPKDYLEEIHDIGEIISDKSVTLEITLPYDFCDPEQRGQWVDIFVALVQYLRSGESKVQFLSASHPRNLIHKVLELLKRFLY